MMVTESIQDLWKARVRLYGDLTFARTDAAEEIADEIQIIEERIIRERSRNGDDFYAKLCWLKKLAEDPADNADTIQVLVASMDLDCTTTGIGGSNQTE